jgi:tetratricopeptide (TPR) repeat protein
VKSPEVRFLLLLCVCTCGAAFVFDPKLGMPRDWDLFSFAGVPLALLTFRLLLNKKWIKERYLSITLLAVGLGFLSLFARAVSLAIPQSGITQFKSYAQLDKKKNMYGKSVLVDYYHNAGDSAMTQKHLEELLAEYSEWEMNERAMQLRKLGRYPEAIALLKRAQEMNPTFPAPLSNLGNCYLYLKEYDSALVYLHYAEGINPYNPAVRVNLGYACYFLKDFRAAEKAWLRAHQLNKDLAAAIMALLKLYQETVDTAKYVDLLLSAGKRSNAHPSVLKELVVYYADSGNRTQAAEAFRRALERGLNPRQSEYLKTRYPFLAQ